MTMPSLPPQGSTDWYSHYQVLHGAATDVVAGRLTDGALRSVLVSFWKATETVPAGTVQIAPTGETIIRTAAGTTGPVYDAAEQSAWTVVPVASTAIADATVVGRQVLTAAEAGSVRLAIDAQRAGDYVDFQSFEAALATKLSTDAVVDTVAPYVAMVLVERNGVYPPRPATASMVIWVGVSDPAGASVGGVNGDLFVTGGTVTVVVAGAAVIAPTLTTEVTAGDGQAIQDWVYTPGTDGTVVDGIEEGRDGTDTSGAGAWSIVVPLGTQQPDGTYRGSRTFNKLINGSVYNLSATMMSGTATVGTAVTKSATPTGAVTSPTPSTRIVPLVGKSGMAWNSVVFGHGTTPEPFETWRGRAVDGVVYFPARQTWADMKQLPGRRAGDLMVYSVPPFPEGIGGSNGNVAAGSYDANIRDFATSLVNAGWNTDLTVIRLGWENNGTWYQWSWDKGGVTNWINAYRRFVDQARAAGLTNVRWNWCLNKGPQAYNNGYSWTTAYPGDSWVDVVGIDPYDHWTPSFTDADWTSNTTGKNPGLQDVADFCRVRGKMMSVDEWGVSHDPNSGGNDNPFYVGKIFEFCQANSDILAWDNTYDHAGAPATLNHKLSDGSNPNAAARYRQLYPNGWGG